MASFNAGDDLNSRFIHFALSASLAHQLVHCVSRGFGIHETFMHTHSIDLQPNRNSSALPLIKPCAPIAELI